MTISKQSKEPPPAKVLALEECHYNTPLTLRSLLRVLALAVQNKELGQHEQDREALYITIALATDLAPQPD